MDFKIICKCGTPYRFEIDLEDGKVPPGVKCPSCETNGSTPVNALLLAQAMALEMKPHPNGEAMIAVKLNCQCGLRFKIDCQPKMMKLPMVLKCPGCQDDKTDLANQILESKITGKPMVTPLYETADTQHTLYLRKEDLSDT